jgi:mannose-6-phosphate isomerase
MATSNNVLRAALTPKHRDVDNLLASLTWTFGVQHSVEPRPLLSPVTAGYSRVYDSPGVLSCSDQVSPGKREAHAVSDGPSILIVTKGQGRFSTPGEDDTGPKEGGVVFIGAGVDVSFSSGGADPLVLYRAYYP